MLSEYFDHVPRRDPPLSPSASRVASIPLGTLALAVRRKVRSAWIDATDAARLLTPSGRRVAARFDDLYNSQKGATGIVICNGPSLNHTDLSLAKGLPSILMNRGYLLHARIPGEVVGICVSARPVLEQYGSEILQLNVPVIIPRRDMDLIDTGADALPLSLTSRWEFATRLRSSFYPGYTVTWLALQFANHLGWDRTLVVGLDHRYDQTGDPSKRVSTVGSDSNHFDPNYFADGSSWLLPDLAMNEYSYELAREATEADARRIVDCTVGGNCPVFERSTLEHELRDRAPQG